MEVILKWCSKSVFIYHKVTKKTKAHFLFSLLLCGLSFLHAALYLILTLQLPVFGNFKTFILLGYKVFTTFVVEPLSSSNNYLYFFFLPLVHIGLQLPEVNDSNILIFLPTLNLAEAEKKIRLQDRKV